VSCCGRTETARRAKLATRCCFTNRLEQRNDNSSVKLTQLHVGSKATLDDSRENQQIDTDSRNRCSTGQPQKTVGWRDSTKNEKKMSAKQRKPRRIATFASNIDKQSISA
jgi:hypothetical protein